MRVYSEREFDDQSLQCPKCGWAGVGGDAHIIDFYGISRVMEAHCPGCDKQLGNVKRQDRSDRNGPGPSDRFQIG